MGYACPVCEVPQRDGTHLANHMAFTALLRHEDHETWLDDHVDDWSDMGAAELAAVVTDYAEETDFEQVFEDTTEGAGGHDHPHNHARSPETRGVQRSTGTLDAETQQILREAQDLTRRMRADDHNESEDADSDAAADVDDSDADEETDAEDGMDRDDGADGDDGTDGKA